jgi:hypothetical protein
MQSRGIMDQAKSYAATATAISQAMTALSEMTPEQQQAFQDTINAEVAAGVTGVPSVSPTALGIQDDTTQGYSGGGEPTGGVGGADGVGEAGIGPDPGVGDRDGTDVGGRDGVGDAGIGPDPGPDDRRRGGLIGNRKRNAPIRGKFRHAQRFALGGQVGAGYSVDNTPSVPGMTSPGMSVGRMSGFLGYRGIQDMLMDLREPQSRAYRGLAAVAPGLPGMMAPGVSPQDQTAMANEIASGISFGERGRQVSGTHGPDTLGGVPGQNEYGGLDTMNDMGRTPAESGPGPGGVSGGMGTGDVSAGPEGMGDTRRKGGPTGDDRDGKFEAVPIVAHEGEYVHRPEAVKHYGVAFMKAINERKIPKKAAIGLLSMMKEKPGRGLLG